MFSSRSVKMTARQLLKDNIGRYAAACLIPLCAFFADYIIACIAGTVFNEVALSVVFLFLVIFTAAPLFYGTVKYFWDNSNGVESSLSTVFICFENAGEFLRVIKLSGLIFAFNYVLQIVLGIPAVILSSVANGDLFSFFGVTAPLWTAKLSGFEDIIYYICSALAIMLSFLIYPILFIAVTNSKTDILNAFAISLKITRFTYFTFIKNLFSYLGLIILSVFVLPLIFTLPYFVMCYITHCRFAIAAYNKINANK